MRRPPRSLGALFSHPPFGAVAIIFAFLAALALAWLVPDLVWGHWQSSGWDESQQRQGIPLQASHGALLANSQSVKLTHQCSRADPAIVRRAWTPRAADIRNLEADLRPVLRAIDDTLTKLPNDQSISLTAYFRQYGGLELETGERIIYVNAFHPSQLAEFRRDGADSTRWLREPIIVCDGWRAFWGIEYDPIGRRFRGFAFNGQA
jgi:hypothetical protein